MSKYKTAAAAARQRARVQAADSVTCDVCGTVCEPTGSAIDAAGFTVSVGICDECDGREAAQ